MEIVGTVGLIFTIIFGVLGIISWVDSRRFLHTIKDNIKKTTHLINSTTDLLEVSARIGIKAAHKNRGFAIQNFKFLNDPKFIVVGSSLKGLKVLLPKFEQILKARADLELENRFLLTHPCYSRFREQQENRTGGDIKSEIEEMANFLLRCGIRQNNIRFYLGTPTCFLTITSKSMLLNPYPYQVEAFQCFCLEVERKKIKDVKDMIAEHNHIQNHSNKRKYEHKYSDYEDLMSEARFDEFKAELEKDSSYDYSFDIAEDIYAQYYWYHYYLPWHSNFSLTFDEYKNTCSEIINDCLNNNIQKKNCSVFKDQKVVGLN